MPCISKNSAYLLLISSFVVIAGAQSGDTSLSGNLARGRTLTASSTCGSTQPEHFCSQPSSNTECAVCDLSEPDLAHPASHMIDEEQRTWWQSEGGESNVTIQLDLENAFFFTHILILFKSPVPAALYLEKSVDFGSTYQVLQYYSTDCEKNYNMPDTPSGSSSRDVICTSAHEEGEVLYLVFPPPSTPDFSNADNVTRAKLTNLRVHLEKFNNLTGLHVEQNFHYAVYHLEVWGHCFCSGNAEQCHQTAAEMANGAVPSLCQCVNGTTGTNCEECLPLYRNEPWKNGFGPQDGGCTECECNGHASSCHYDTDMSGGVCDDCSDGTTGSECEMCQEGFYRSASAPITDACLACACSLAGTEPGTFCGKQSGQCTCKTNVNGPLCDQCQDGFFELDKANPNGCQACNCSDCEKLTGRCPCNGDPSCCPFHQYHDGTSCQECGCSHLGSYGVCDLSGACICRPGVGGRKCDVCLPGYFNLSATGCEPCDCNLAGSSNPSECDLQTGQCSCHAGVLGRRCDKCPLGTIGPSAETSQPCINCFCNDIFFETECYSASGWYLAESSNFFDSANELDEWVTSGSRSYNSGLLVHSNDLNEIHVYFPGSYTGDKRTAYSLNFSLSVGFPSVQSSISGIEMSLVIYGRPGKYDRVRIQKSFSSLSQEIMTYQVPLVAAEFEQIMYYRQPATEEYLRRTLANINTMKLVVVFPPGVPEEERLINISSAKMLYANQIYDPSAVPQSQEVSFVEECSCPSSRQGQLCSQCSPGYTFDPSFGGEFSKCVRCYCNGYSETCDPVSSVCQDCRNNRTGDNCEDCVVGFYHDPTTWECLPCLCPGGPFSSNHFAYSCTSDMCDCYPGFIGDNCGSCDSNYMGNPLLPGEDCVCSEPGYVGRECQFCDEGYFGDALQMNCTDCGCNAIGTVNGTQCHPVTGQCSCKIAVTGRTCDRCDDGYWDFASGGGCKNCNCSQLGSVNSMCDQVNGKCTCRIGYSGRTCDTCADGFLDLGDGKCDQCQPGTTGLLPDCELCDDECLPVSEEEIQTLESSATNYTQLAASINTTNITSSVLLQPLFNLLAEIEMHLNSSEINALHNISIDLFHKLCGAIFSLEDLLRRAVLVRMQLNTTLANTTVLNSTLTEIITSLQSLESLFVNISKEAAQLKTVDFAEYVNIIKMAEERSNISNELVQTNVSFLISDIDQTLQEFQSKEKQFWLILDEVTSLIFELKQAITLYQLLVDEASRSLCGNPQGNKCDGGGVCGGVECDMCGGEGCNGSVNQVQQAGNISNETLRRANDLLQSLLNTVDHLRLARNESQLALNNSIEAQRIVELAQHLALELSTDIAQLTITVVNALNNNLNLFGLEMLEQIENETLLLHISKTPEEVYAVLEEINSTIAQIQALLMGVDVEDLRRRAEEAHSTSELANATAHEVLDNISILRKMLEEFQDSSKAVEDDIINTNETTASAKSRTEQARNVLDTLTSSLGELELRVSSLNTTVTQLQSRFNENLNRLDNLRILTEDLNQTVRELENTTRLEEELSDLQIEASAKLVSAMAGLDDAEKLKRMAGIVRERAIQQLIMAERLLNRRECIVEQQLHIKDDIKRVATELEGLNRLIESHVGRNTICQYEF